MTFTYWCLVSGELAQIPWKKLLQIKTEKLETITTKTQLYFLDFYASRDLKENLSNVTLTRN